MARNDENNDESVSQQPSPSSPPSSSSNSKWWILSFGLILLMSFVIQRQLTNQTDKSVATERLFTANELQSFTKDELYLAILGHVFNVSSAPRFYSSTGSYKFYTGRDASRSFYTGGTTSEDLTDDLTDLSDDAMAAVYNWLTFYQKTYPVLGKLIGRYFDSNGTPTKHFHDVLVSVENMKKKNEEKAQFAQKWPSCNSEWSQNAGRRVWCTDKSGGIERAWAGYPRRFFDSSSKVERCVCIEKADSQDGRFKLYDNCPSTSDECRLEEK